MIEVPVTNKHLADELDYQIDQIWKKLSDLPPTGGLGWGDLEFELLADVAKRASHALRKEASV